jgi:hypothetical protein
LSKDNIHENILKSSFCCFSAVQKYTEFKIHKTPEGILDISPCELYIRNRKKVTIIELFEDFVG